MCLCRDGDEIAVVYQRCCYTPVDFPTEAHWSALLMMERSRAILCPSVGYHLAGRKKVQQELTVPGVVEKFMNGDLEASKRIRATFAQQFTLDLVLLYTSSTPTSLAQLLCISLQLYCLCHPG